jgi:hypothetical protein
MRISKFKVFENGTALGAIGTHFVAGMLAFGGTADLLKGWSDIIKHSILNIVKLAAVATDVAWTHTFTPATFTVGNEFVLSIKSPDSRQQFVKIFKYKVVSGDTATSVVTAFKALINASSLPITATGSTTLTLTADVAGTGINYVVTAGATGASTFVGSALTGDAVKTDAAHLAAKYENVDAVDFASTTDAYIQYLVKYKDTDGVERYAACFVDDGTTVTALNNAINGNYAAVTEQDGVIAEGAV